MAFLRAGSGSSGGTSVKPISMGSPTVLAGQYFIDVIILDNTSGYPSYTYKSNKCELLGTYTFRSGWSARIIYFKALADGTCNSFVSNSNSTFGFFSVFSVE